MPSEPDNKIDDLLRTYARKRREDLSGPPELHPATRRMLQAEAAKLRPPQTAGPRTVWAWLTAHWPRVAVSCGVFTALAALVWNSFPDKEGSPAPMVFAKQDRSLTKPSEERQKLAAESARFESQLAGTAPRRTMAVADRKSDNTDAQTPLADEAKAQVHDGDKPTLPPVPKPTATAASGLSAKAVATTAEPAGRVEANALDLGKTQAPPRKSAPARTPPSLNFADGAAPPGSVDFLAAKDASGAANEPVKPAGSVSTKLKFNGQVEDANRKKSDSLARQDPQPSTFGGGFAPTAAPFPSPAARMRTAAVAAASPSPAASTPATPGPAVSMAQAQTNRYYRFERQPEMEAVAAGRKGMMPVKPLSSFEFELNGEQVRVLDRDGSVYSGRLLSSAEETEERLANLQSVDKRLQVGSRESDNLTAKPTQPALAQPLNGPAAARIAFRVTGTNRTSGQRISFAGILTDASGFAEARELFILKPAPTTAPTPPLGRPVAQPLAKLPASAATTTNGAQESRQLVGRLRIGDSSETAIIAVPSPK